MIDGATAPAISNVFVNNACASCTLQITGTFTAATVLVEGIVNVASNQWVTLAAFNLSDLSLEKDGADKAGIYQVGIEGILRVRMNVTEVSGGNITIAAQFGNATINQFSKTEASNLVPITAYDLAVAGGYTGTLEQFETDMGNSASNATAAANSADEAAQTLTDVQTAGTEAVDAVQAKGQEVLASIPEDYTELTGEVDDLKTQTNQYKDYFYDISKGFNSELNVTWYKGKISDHGAVTDGETTTVYSSRTDVRSADSFAKVTCDPSVEYRVIYYNSWTTQYNTYVKRTGYTSTPTYIDAGYVIRVQARYKESPDVNITDLTPFYTLINIGNCPISNIDPTMDAVQLNIANLQRDLRNRNGFFYTSSSHRHSWTTYGSKGGISFTMGGKTLNKRLYPGNGSSVSVMEISTDITDYVTENEDSITFILPRYSYALVYSLSDGLLHLRDYMTSSNIVASDVLLLACQYALPVKGILYDEYIDRNVEDRINDSYVKTSDIFNGEPYSGTYDFVDKVKDYCALLKEKTNIEKFAFFTDPHVGGLADSNRNSTAKANYFKKVQKVYNNSPCSFVVCGGDYLNNSNTPDEACYRLGQLTGINEHLLSECKFVIGNHDDNYQGTEALSRDTLASIMFQKTDTKKCYYSFDGMNSKCYVLDTGRDSSHTTANNYDKEQAEWLANKLGTDDADHSIIFLHIIMNDGSIAAAANLFGSIVSAYNSRGSVTVNENTYDFTDCNGKVEFWVAGHTHTDSNGTLGGIPYFITASNGYTSDIPLIDLIVADYESRIVKLVRVGGTGEDREIELV